MKTKPWYKKSDEWFDNKSAAMPKMPPWFWIAAIIILEVFLSF